ncbi:MAG: putative baseplate assembly protein [Verrucomicrobia bacterium]|nr:putative baseplate assembly protein [Verrucomicrobiota bacterium]
MIYRCCVENRKAAVLANPALNGIDYLEVLDSEAIPLGSPRQQTLLVHCLNPLMPANWTTDNVLIEGGESITDITLDWVQPALAGSPPQVQATGQEQNFFASLPDATKVLVVRTHTAGDFSAYRLRLVNSAVRAAQDPFEVTEALAGFDPELAEVSFSFKVECGPDFDCAPPGPGCSPPTVAPPQINYLAKDYGSFRTVILDRLNQLLPAWTGTSEADPGVALAELIAYRADHLSYQQDAIATEAYIETARSRVSLRRHARLVDYHVHDGCNARTWIQLTVAANPGEPVFLDRTLTRFYTYAPGMPPILAVGDGTEEAALLSGVQVFQPMQDALLYAAHNRMFFYTWGNTECCLPQGAVEATLNGSYPNLRPGDVLVFQEVVGPQTGNAADADLRHRCAVRLTHVATVDANGRPLVDPLFDPSGAPVSNPATQKPAPVTELQWAQDDALPFPVCISSIYLDSSGTMHAVANVSVAFGNVVLADHGVSIAGTSLGQVPAPRLHLPRNPATDRCQPALPIALPVRFRPAIPDRPLTHAVPQPLAGVPATPGVTLLDGTGTATLTDANGFICLTARASDPAGWPQFFGVAVQQNQTTPANFDLSVVYPLPAGAAAAPIQTVALERFTNLSLKAADANYVAAKINSLSRLIRVPPGYSPPATPPSGFPATLTMLTAPGTINLQDLSSPPITYLTLQAANPANWPQSFGVLAQAIDQPPSNENEGPSAYNLAFVYYPASGGVGVTLPVTVEQFQGLSSAGLTSQLHSRLFTVNSFAGAPDLRLPAADLIQFDPAKAVPQITLDGTFDGTTTRWHPEHDLLGSAGSDRAFVVEIESDGTANLRFATPPDPGSASAETNGMVPEPGTAFVAEYRIGNGTGGNVGAESLVYLAAVDARIRSCTNPLPARGGTDPETGDQIRRRAPQAFLSQSPSALLRSVTTADYEAAAATNPQVDQAVASLRWTGSWYSVFIAVEPGGGGNLTDTLQKSLETTVERYRLAGQDLKLESPQYLSLEIELQVCVDPSYFRADVEKSLLQVLGNGILPNGQKGFFYPDNFTFGKTVYLSPVYAAARSVPGVISVAATKFQPQGVNTARYLNAGQIKMGSLQVARLDNDPSHPGHGKLTLIVQGGK